MPVELTTFGTYFAEGLELVENKPFNMLEGAELLLHLFDNQMLRGRVLRADPGRALVEVADRRWWLERQSDGYVGHWVVRSREGAERHSCRHPDELT